MKKIFFLFILSIFIFVSKMGNASPFPQPLIKNGTCPSGYYSSGAYCVPTQSAKFAIAKVGSCPYAYYSSGNYCVASSDKSPLAMPKIGSCPSGYYSSGEYCVATR